MITKDEAIRISKMKHLFDVEMLAVIELYIFEKKGVSVSINRPNNIIDLQLMNMAYDTAANYFLSNS